MKALIDNAADARRDLNLSYGIALSAEQIARLQQDIVWYVEAEVDGQRVLVPQLYLADASRAKLTQQGAVITGKDVTLTSVTGSITNSGTIAARRDLDLTAQKDLVNQSGHLSAGRDATLEAVEGSVKAVTRSMNLEPDGTDVQTVEYARAVVSAGRALTVDAGGDIVIRAAEVTAGGELTLTADGGIGIGANALTSTRTFSTEKTYDHVNAVSHVGSLLRAGGALTLDAGGAVTLNAGEGIAARVGVGQGQSLEAAITTLAGQPGTEWVGQLAARDDVAWSGIQEAWREWDYEASGLSGPAAAVIALAVTVATQGMGASILGASGTMGAMASAGFSAIVSQATVSFISNKGDLGKVLAELGSSESVRSLLTTVITAGATAGILDTLKLPPTEAMTFGDRLVDTGVSTGVNLTVNTVVGGQDFNDALVSGALSMAGSMASQMLFKGIGDFAEDLKISDGDIRKVITHAVAGCAVGQIQNQCVAGAIGAGLQELGGDVLAELTSDPAQQARYAGLLAGATALALDQDAAAVTAAILIAQDANTYNRQLHRDEIVQVKMLAPEFAAQNGISVEEAERRLLAQAMRDVDREFGEAYADWDQSAQQYLRQNAVGTIEVRDRDVLMFTPGGRDFFDDPTILSGTLASFEREFTEVYAQTPNLTKEEKFAVQREVLGHYLSAVSMLPAGGSIIALLVDYDDARRRNDTGRMKEILVDLPAELLPRVKLFGQIARKMADEGELSGVGGGSDSGHIGDEIPEIGAPRSGVIAQYGPLNKGPLPEEIANTFRSGSYREVITSRPTTLYRVIAENGNPNGGYWTRTRPEGPLQSVIDSALDQNWGNTATRVVEMEVPAGTRLFEGVAAPQRGLVGGGNQVFFDRNINTFNKNWIK